MVLVMRCSALYRTACAKVTSRTVMAALVKSRLSTRRLSAAELMMRRDALVVPQIGANQERPTSHPADIAFPPSRDCARFLGIVRSDC
jgi:hypothetical protein